MKSGTAEFVNNVLRRAWVCAAALLTVGIFGDATRLAAQQTFNSGSDGSDGAYAPSGPPGTIVVFDPTAFHGNQVAANIFNFSTITIPTGVTVRLSGNVINGPVFWLSQGNVNIQGLIDLSGGFGHDVTANPFARVPSVPGPGGYPGGVGGNNTGQVATRGNGPGGGGAGTSCSSAGVGGAFSGNQFLIPLIGGSGAGGGTFCDGRFGQGGGAGGGALMIASSTQIVVGGEIDSVGGEAGSAGGGGGSGGAIRLVSNTITGAGKITARGAVTSGITTGGPGQVRLEAYVISFTGALGGTQSQSAPFPLLIPTAGPSSARVVSINGVAVNPNPSVFPDITINTTSPVPVVIQTQNIPATATISLTILDENSVPDTVVQAPPLGNCNASNVCTTTVNVVFPFGASRGLTKVTWTQ